MQLDPESAALVDRIAELSDCELLLAMHRISNASLLRSCDRWQALGNVWAVMPFAFGGSGWLMALWLGPLLPPLLALAVGLWFGLGALAVGSWRLRKVGQLPDSMPTPTLDFIKRELARRHGGPFAR